jgi:hypothetical protein
MSGLFWIAQIILAGVFFFTGFTKIFAYKPLMHAVQTYSKGKPSGVSRGQALFIGAAEVLGAIGVIWPTPLMPSVFASGHLLVLLSSCGLACIMVLATIYHMRRNESAAPAISGFLLALFVIVGRWPNHPVVHFFNN